MRKQISTHRHLLRGIHETTNDDLHRELVKVAFLHYNSLNPKIMFPNFDDMFLPIALPRSWSSPSGITYTSVQPLEKKECIQVWNAMRNNSFSFEKTISL